MGITPNLECTRLNDVQGHNSYGIDEFWTILLLEVALADA